MQHCKTISEAVGGLSGIGLTITMNWGHIAEKGIETAILALIGGVFGALGGLILAWMIREVKKLF